MKAEVLITEKWRQREIYICAYDQSQLKNPI